jgi:hypothetical protein
LIGQGRQSPPTYRERSDKVWWGTVDRVTRPLLQPEKEEKVMTRWGTVDRVEPSLTAA